MKIAIASDHGGYNLKESLKEHLKEQGIMIKDFGTNSLESCDYPDFGRPAAQAVANGEVDFGILICTTWLPTRLRACVPHFALIPYLHHLQDFTTMPMFWYSAPELSETFLQSQS